MSSLPHSHAPSSSSSSSTSSSSPSSSLSQQLQQLRVADSSDRRPPSDTQNNDNINGNANRSINPSSSPFPPPPITSVSAASLIHSHSHTHIPSESSFFSFAPLLEQPDNNRSLTARAPTHIHSNAPSTVTLSTHQFQHADSRSTKLADLPDNTLTHSHSSSSSSSKTIDLSTHVTLVSPPSQLPASSSSTLKHAHQLRHLVNSMTIPVPPTLPALFERHSSFVAFPPLHLNSALTSSTALTSINENNNCINGVKNGSRSSWWWSIHACVESLLSMGDEAEFKLLLGATPSEGDANTSTANTHSSVSIHDSTSTTPRLEGLFIQRGEAVVFHIHYYLLPPLKPAISSSSASKPSPLDKTGIVIECQRRCGDAFLFQFFVQHLLTLLRQHVNVQPFFEFAANSLNNCAATASSTSSSSSTTSSSSSASSSPLSPCSVRCFELNRSALRDDYFHTFQCLFQMCVSGAVTCQREAYRHLCVMFDNQQVGNSLKTNKSNGDNDECKKNDTVDQWDLLPSDSHAQTATLARFLFQFCQQQQENTTVGASSSSSLMEVLIHGLHSSDVLIVQAASKLLCDLSCHRDLLPLLWSSRHLLMLVAERLDQATLPQSSPQPASKSSSKPSSPSPLPCSLMQVDIGEASVRGSLVHFLCRLLGSQSSYQRELKESYNQQLHHTILNCAEIILEQWDDDTEQFKYARLLRQYVA